MTKQEIMKKYGDVAIHCDTEDKANELLHYLDGKGFRWCSDNSLTLTNNYDWLNNQTCYRIRFGDRVSFSDIEYFKEMDLKIITFEEFMRGEVSMKKEPKLFNPEPYLHEKPKLKIKQAPPMESITYESNPEHYWQKTPIRNLDTPHLVNIILYIDRIGEKRTSLHEKQLDFLIRELQKRLKNNTIKVLKEVKGTILTEGGKR